MINLSSNKNSRLIDFAQIKAELEEKNQMITYVILNIII